MQQEVFLEIKELIINSISKDELKEKLSDYHESDIADVLETLTKEERRKTYAALGIERTAEVFSYYDDAQLYIKELDSEVAADIIEQMDSDDAINVLNDLEDDSKSEIIDLMEGESQEKVKQLDAYAEEVIGSYMSDNYIVVGKEYTIKQAMSKLVMDAGEHDNIATIYVVEENNKYYGAISLRDLIVARKDEKLLDLCMTSYPSFYDDEEMSDCLNRLKDYAEDSIPVISRNGTLLGVITSDDVVDAVDEEMSDDYAKLGGLSESEELDESTFVSIKKRIPWLLILLFLGLIVSSVIGLFEGVIASLPAIVFFQSMILDMSGNVGTQSLAVTIRNLTNEEIKGKKILKNVLKEIRVGFVNGLIIGVVGFLFVIAFLSIRHQEIVAGNGYLFSDTMKVAVIISSSLLVAMTLSSFVGTIFPIVLNKMHIDPAVASGPFITTINDVIAVLIYYGLTYLLFLLVL